MTVTLTEEMVRSLTWMAKRLPLAGRKLRGTFLYECKRHRRMGHTKVGGARPTTRGGGEKWIFGDWIGGWPAWKEGGDWLAAFAWSLKSVPACCAYRRPVNSILERTEPASPTAFLFCQCAQFVLPFQRTACCELWRPMLKT